MLAFSFTHREMVCVYHLCEFPKREEAKNDWAKWKIWQTRSSITVARKTNNKWYEFGLQFTFIRRMRSISRRLINTLRPIVINTVRTWRTWMKLKIDANSPRHGNDGNLIFKSVPLNRSGKNTTTKTKTHQQQNEVDRRIYVAVRCTLYAVSKIIIKSVIAIFTNAHCAIAT